MILRCSVCGKTFAPTCPCGEAEAIEVNAPEKLTGEELHEEFRKLVFEGEDNDEEG